MITGNKNINCIGNWSQNFLIPLSEKCHYAFPTDSQQYLLGTVLHFYPDRLPTHGWQLAVCRPADTLVGNITKTTGWLLAVCRPMVDQQLAVCWLTVSQQYLLGTVLHFYPFLSIRPLTSPCNIPCNSKSLSTWTL